MAGLFKRRLCQQKGQALIELTLIVPLMVLLAFGAIEVGSVISTYLTLTHTTREGANLASRGGGMPWGWDQLPRMGAHTAVPGWNCLQANQNP